MATTRGARSYLRLVAELKAQWRAARKPCARCGQPIDYTLESWHPASLVAGHIKPWAKYPELRMDPANFQPEHRDCGQKASDSEDQTPGLGTTSTDW